MKKGILILALSFCGILGFASVKVFHVRDFGAVYNDNKDDTEAIQKCINEAVKYSDSKIIFGSGVYNVNKQLAIDYTNKSLEISSEMINGKIAEIHSTSQEHIIHARGFFTNPSTGTFKLNQIKIIGNNIPYSSKHPNINKKEWKAALIITDMSNVYIDNVQIENFYGQGIHITTTDPLNLPLNSRFKFVEITNCKLIDVWGSNPKFDDYGDAIYLANVANGIVKNNYIENKLLRTNQLGRCGIVLEFFSENIQVLNNQIVEGYDRPLHIENTYGGHSVKNNIFKGSDLGIVIVENFEKPYKPTIFSKNNISNVNLLKNVKFTKSYGEGSYGDRSFVFIITTGKSKENLIIFQDNEFIVDDNYIYNSNSVFNIRSKNVELLGNTFKSTSINKNYSIFNYGKSKLSNNKLQNNFDIR
ncbi:right-handed parallel beta-helix repeat-containing protein [Chryseobacterium sp. Bi04]|uniref:right-handed parallel beta-helix repeat-containing protein n=1 Tax=Chryseobacterium sp. Bi04 TaxID=2822345 RepID=UPI001DBF4024|nr:right-handed parallel beta-helix repeat-containing protein [Chryseobacterium sp. Bi04]CAH0274528.1 hypothetical protein SRABI04_03865 [Chryseobacterium sp. Bi04]